MVTVLASIKVAPGRLDEFLREYETYSGVVLGERGCLEYIPCVDQKTGLPMQQLDPQVVTVVEHWDSLEAMYAHLEGPAMQEFMARVQGMLEGFSLKVLKRAW